MARSRRGTPPAFRRYLGTAAQEWAEAERWSKAWAPHLSQCRTLLDSMIDEIPVRRLAIVLGSGILGELPIESLGRCFERVVLIDRAHLAAGDRRVRRYPGIERVWADLAFRKPSELTDLLAPWGDPDWVISANLLAELAAAPNGAEAVSAHLDGLAALSCPATLITSLDRRVLNRHGVLLEGGNLLGGRDMPRSGQRWKWERRPFASARQATREVHTIGAWEDWRKA